MTKRTQEVPNITVSTQSLEAERSGARTSLQWEPVFAPALFQTLFWTPRFSRPTPAMLHVPLLFWLSTVMQPKRVTVIGCDDGVAHFAFCQAIDKLGLDARCHGYGFWGARDAGKAELKVPEQFRAHADMLYEGQSILHAGVSFAAALEHANNTPTDILFVDLEALPREDYVSGEALLSRLAAQGVLVLHGTNALTDREIYGRNLAQFIRGASHVEFSAGEGLMLVMGGQNELPSPLKALLDLGPDGTLHGGVEFAFRRTGQGMFAVAEAAELANKFHKTSKDIVAAKTELKSKQEIIEQVKTALEDRGRKFAGVQSELFDKNNEVNQLRQQMTALKAETDTQLSELGKKYKSVVQAADSAKSAHHDEVTSLVNTVSSLRSELERTQAELEGALESGRVLSESLEQLHQEVEQERAARLEELSALSDNVLRLRSELERVLAERDMLAANLDLLRANAEADKTAFAQERVVRFEETATLTRLAEDLRIAKAEAEKAKIAAENALQTNTLEFHGKTETLSNALEKLRSELQGAIRDRDGAARRLDQVLAEGKLAVERERKARFEETAALTQIAEGVRKAKVRDEAALHARINELEHQVTALYASTSWKVSAPIRWVKRALKT